MSKPDEMHLGMNASPFISLFSGIHSQSLMERADKEGSRYEWSDCEREGTEEGGRGGDMNKKGREGGN